MSKFTQPTKSILAMYLSEIDNTPLLTATQEKELALSIAEGDREARNHMVKANLRLVVNIARGYLGKGLSLEDLIEEGNLGLMRAAESFDGTMGTRFSTYASYWIKQSIRRAVINNATPLRIPAYMVSLLSKWRRAEGILTRRLERNPTPEEIGAALKLSKKKLAIVMAAKVVENRRCRQAHEADEGEDYLLGEHPDDRTPPDVFAEDLELTQLILGRLDLLEDREATILRLRFGLGEALPQTLGQVGEILGLSRERIRQIERLALVKLTFFAGEDPAAGILTVHDTSRTNGKEVRRPRKGAKQSISQPQQNQGAEVALQANGTVTKPEKTDSQAKGTVQQFEKTGLLTAPLKRFRLLAAIRVRQPAQAKLAPPVDGESNPATIGATACRCQLPEDELDPIDGRNSRTSRQATKAAKACGKAGRRRFIDPTTCDRRQTDAEFQFGNTMRMALHRHNKLELSPEEILLAAASIDYRYLPDPPPETRSPEIQTEEGKPEQFLVDRLLAIQLEIALADYKRSACRQFPTWSEVLEVMANLGYRRVQVAE